MNAQKFGLLFLLIVVSITSGCTSYRVTSNINSSSVSADCAKANVIISEDSLLNRKYEEIGPIEVSMQKWTIFSSFPTRERMNEVFVEKARDICADAVIEARYYSGLLKHYMYGQGIGVKLSE